MEMLGLPRISIEMGKAGSNSNPARPKMKNPVSVILLTGFFA
jgi:hypothetical protein